MEMLSGKRVIASGDRQSCLIHPVVLLSIIDHYSRREDKKRVMGSLLGKYDPKNRCTHITNSFAVPHEEASQVALDVDFHNSMLDMYTKLNPNEELVGWYITNPPTIDEKMVMFHGYYEGEVSDPVLLCVDTELTGGEMSIQSYTSLPLTFAAEEEAPMAQFQEIPYQMDMFESRDIGMSFFAKQRNAGASVYELPPQFTTLENTMEDIYGRLDSIEEYIDDVLSGKEERNAKIGEMLYNTLAQHPSLGADMFQELFHNNVQDILMMVYLANLTKAQLKIAEELTTNSAGKSSQSHRQRSRNRRNDYRSSSKQTKDKEEGRKFHQNYYQSSEGNKGGRGYSRKK